MITQDELKQNVSYDEHTGEFRWARKGPKIRIGNLAGTKHIQGYISMTINGGKYLAHRLAWLYVYGKMPTNLIDHINGNRSDNRIKNLREATRSDNQANSRILNSNTSGYKGVIFRKDRNKWIAVIKKNQKTKYLGSFDTPRLAYEAYCKAAIIEFGSFARVA